MKTNNLKAANPIETILQRLDAADLWEKDIKLKRKDFLKLGGTTDTNIYYVVSGSLSIYIEDEWEAQIIRFGYPGAFIAALDSYISGQTSPFFIQAIKKCQLKSISKAAFQTFIASDAALVSLWQTILKGLIFQQLEREIDILTNSPLARYRRVSKRSPHLFQEIPAKYIASYLRMSPETLSRIRKLDLNQDLSHRKP